MRLIWLSLLAAGLLTAAQPGRLADGSLFPPLKGDYLSGRDASLPDDAKGKVIMIAMGFSYDARFGIEDFAKRYREGLKSESNWASFKVAFIGGAGRLAKPFIVKGMKRDTPKDEQERFVTVFNEVSEWKARMGVSNDKSAYVVVLDRRGGIAWLKEARVTDGKVDEALVADAIRVSKTLSR